jgi:adenylate cyclase
LQSTNGTYVNGRRVAEVVLNDGDRISVAGLDLVFHSAE